MPINPIFALELRQRWRNNRSFLLLLGIALALSLLTVFTYDKAVNLNLYRDTDPMFRGSNAVISNANAQLGAVGRELFIALAHTNILCWLLLAATSAATGIASERQRGLLESLQLSHISARSQIAARFGANTMLLGALQLVLLPIYALTFIMGGVSPAEVAQAFLLVAWASITGTSLGLWFSARAHRPTGALFSALGVLASWTVGVWIGYLSLGSPILIGLDWFYLLHPSALFMALTIPNFVWLTTFGNAIWMFSAAHFLICAALLWSATRNVGRTLPPATWGQKSLFVEKLRARQAATPPKSRAAQRASGALLSDIPLDRFVHFTDPLLAREVKARFRLRRAGFWLGAVRGLLLLMILSIWIFGVASLFDQQARRDTAQALIYILLFGGALILAVLAATSWTREREAGTWESLKLSLLTPREIIRAKWLSPLVSFAYYSLPLWILLPIGALFTRFDSVVVGLSFVVVWLALSVALGLLISWRVKNGTGAIAWTVGLLMLLLVGAPILDESLGVSYAITQQRFGIGGSYTSYSYFGREQNDDVISARYTAETGRPAPRDFSFSAARTLEGRAEFENWRQDYGRRAERFRRNLRASSPLLTLGDVFSPGDSRFFEQKPEERPGTVAAWLLFGALPPALSTLGLLWLLRRDVQREQLRA